MTPKPTHIILIGYMGSGKSTVGAHLATLTGYGFSDTDHLIETSQGLSISQLFEKSGEIQFRIIERQKLLEALAGPPAIISTGGGAPCYEDNMDLMLLNGTVVYLRNQPSTLAKRLEAGKEKRPLLKGRELVPFINEGIRTREPFYGRAHLIVDCDTMNAREIARIIYEKLF